MTRVRHFSLFLNGKKVAEACQEYGGCDSRLFYTHDVGWSCLAVDTIAPVAGMDWAIDQIILTKANVDVRLGLMNGSIWQCAMRVTRANYITDSSSGVMRGHFVFMGGEPEIQPAPVRKRIRRKRHPPIGHRDTLVQSLLDGLRRGLAL